MITNYNFFLDSYPIVVKKELAVNYGLNESVVLQQIYYWITHNQNNNQNFLDNRYWTYNTMESWQKQFPFWCLKTIKTIFNNLHKKNLIISCAPNSKLGDQTKWYTLNTSTEFKKDENDPFFYLHKSRPINIQKRLAYKIGLIRAVVLQQVQYWVEYNRDKKQNFINDKYWVFHSLEDWHQYFPFISLTTVQRIFKSLEEDEIIISGNFHKDKFNKVKWYTVNYKHEIFKKFDTLKNPDLSHSVKMTSSIVSPLIDCEMSQTVEHPDFIENSHFDTLKNPDLSHSVKMTSSETSILHDPYKYTEKNYLIEEKERSRGEIFLKDFIPSNDQIKMIMKANKLTENEVRQALIEFLLKQEELYEGEGQPIYSRKRLNILFTRWCALFPQIKTPQNRKVINEEQKTSMTTLKEKIDQWIDLRSKQSNLDKSLISNFVENLGEEKFDKLFLYCLQIEKHSDGFLRLFLVDYGGVYYSTVYSNIKCISKAVKGITNDLKGIKLYPSKQSFEPSIVIEF